MALQSRIDNSTVPFIRNGYSFAKHGEVIAQDATRATDILAYTVMSQVAATGQWVPWNNAAAVDGSQIPQGVYLGPDIDAADIVDGDVEGAVIMVGGSVEVDGGQLVFDDDTLSADTVVAALTMTGEAILRMFGIFIDETVDISEFEN